MPRRRASSRDPQHVLSLTLKFTQIGSSATMVASCVGDEAPTSSPTETRDAR
jgi:hypothetical protein